MNTENSNNVLEKGMFLQARRDKYYIEFGGEAVVGDSYGAGLLRGVILSRADLQAKIDWELRNFVTAVQQAEQQLETAENDYYKDLGLEEKYLDTMDMYHAAVASYNEAVDRIAPIFDEQLKVLNKRNEEANQIYNEQR